MVNKRILLTGGHFSPALALLERVPKDWEVLFVGRKYGLEGEKIESLEYQTIKKMGIDFKNLDAGRLQRALTRHTVPSLLKVPKGYAQAFTILADFKPDVVVGFGGYISFPVIATAKLLRIPTVIHEQTLAAGQANRMLAPMVDKIAVSWEESLAFFPKNKTVLTGNPIRKSILKECELPAGSEPLIFFTGGSAGSHIINDLVRDSIDTLLSKYRVVVQSGDTKEYSDFKVLTEQRSKLSESKRSKYILKKFIEPSHMGFIMKESDLVVGRAGMNTVTELIRLGKPSILIPLPTGQRKEQERNADFTKSLGLSEVLGQGDTSSKILMETINEVMKNINKYRSNREVLVDNAVDRLFAVIEDVANKKTETKS